MSKLSLAILLTCASHIILAQNIYEPIIHHDFWANYKLPRNASPAVDKTAKHNRFQAFIKKEPVPLYRGFRVSEVRENLIPNVSLSKAFTIEMVVLHHVNSPIACSLFGNSITKSCVFGVGYYNQRDDPSALLDIWVGDKTLELEIEPENKYWYHLMFVNEAGTIAVFCNGKSIGSLEFEDLNEFNLHLASYLEYEPYMAMDNQVKMLNYYDKALNKTEVGTSYATHQQKIKSGIKQLHTFEFLAGPYVHHTAKESAHILWESSKPVYATVCYGESLPLSDSILIQNSNPTQDGYECYIQEVAIKNLKPATKYFYQIKLLDYDGYALQSPTYSFKTAVEAASSFQFAAIGDTETRPHINNQISKQIWGERPDFVIHLGDLTDGGRKQNKWQWNYEYFEGMDQLHQRVPVFPVPGNGEGDLFWYKQYHKLPGQEAYYTFNYGNAFFAMLNSNRRSDQLQKDSVQYVWLDSVLASTDSEWKFVCMHHAPYSTDENDYDNAWEGKENYGDLNMQQVIPLFEKHNVDIVFFGHLHTYSRMGPIQNETVQQENGVWYIQSGGAGGNLEDFGPTRAWFSEKVYRGHHYCMVNVIDQQLVFKMYDIAGNLKDYMEINKASRD